MARTMHDSVTAADIPADAQMVAGYIDGTWVWSAADWTLHPNATHVKVATQPATNAGDVLDCENGDATPADCPAWIRMRQAAGVAVPTVYCARSAMAAVQMACKGLVFDMWVADWTGEPHEVPGAAAVQYADPKTSGGHFDLSAVYDDTWPLTATAPPATGDDEMNMDIARLHVWPWYPNWAGRVGEQAEVDYWAARLAGGENYELVVTEFYNSPECVAYRAKQASAAH